MDYATVTVETEYRNVPTYPPDEKLTDAQERVYRALVEERYPTSEVAEMVGVSQSFVQRVKQKYVRGNEEERLHIRVHISG